MLNDVDFCIELMESDRINVAYIMNLIRNINFESKQTRDRDIEHIKDELDRSDNMRLHKKIDILRSLRSARRTTKRSLPRFTDRSKRRRRR